jgi:hypothetical protein
MEWRREIEHVGFCRHEQAWFVLNCRLPGRGGGCGQEAPAAADGGDTPCGRIGRTGCCLIRVWPMRSPVSYPALSGCRDTGESMRVLPLDGSVSHG